MENVSIIMVIMTIFISYLIGSIPFAVIIAKLMHLKDPRTYGSNNPGATNVLRSGKKSAALLTLIGDAFKGWIMVYLTIKFSLPKLMVFLSALFVIIGHIYSVFLNFKGGKGVATTIGVLLALSNTIAIISIITWVVVFIITRLSSLSSILSSLIMPIVAYFIFIYNKIPSNYTFFYTILIICIFIIYRHKNNIINLIHGKEKKFKSK